MRVRACLSVSRDSRKNDFRIDRAQLLVAEAPALQGSRAEVFDHDVRGSDKPLDDFDAERRAEVRRHRPLVAIQDLVIKANAVLVVAPKSNFIAAIGTLDLHDVRAVVSKKHRDHRAG